MSTSTDLPNLAEEALPLARKLDRDAVEIVLRAHYPQVCRIALALCGRESAGRLTIKTIMPQSVKTLPWWSNDAEATNWFLHHTVLAARENAGANPPATDDDTLITAVSQPTPEHIAFVRSLRLLPIQQREAFLLSRCEHLDLRKTAVAMDCSSGAADTHRMAAEKALSAVAAETFDERVAELVRAYASLTPPDDMILGDIGVVLGKVRRGKVARAIRTIILLILLGAVGWTIWRLSQMIVI
jgi:DNA-directed RNA polymerase specialized sigma24 family protein